MLETCEKHDDCIGRIHENIHNIDKTNAEIKGTMDGFTSSVSDFMKEIRKDMYSKDGVMDRVGRHSNQLALQWGLLAAIVVSLMVGIITGKI